MGKSTPKKSIDVILLKTPTGYFNTNKLSGREQEMLLNYSTCFCNYKRKKVWFTMEFGKILGLFLYAVAGLSNLFYGGFSFDGTMSNILLQHHALGNVFLEDG